jgi:2,4-dienoyl-CoA reductase-like NADH-dependent reductase (Old Yellow Enzyme family)
VTYLGDPVRIGRLEARNRLVFGPHETNLGRGRSISERHVAYYRARARGGAGMIVLEEASVDGTDWPYERSPLAEVAVRGWAETAQACQEEGALVLAALGHSGGQGSSAYHQRVLLAPSGLADVESREMPKAMEDEEIELLVAAFGRAASSAVSAGCDGVEINAGQHSILRQFCSGLTNRRQDSFGQDRTLLARRVLAEVRSCVSRARRDAVVGLRLSCDELAPWAGIVPESAGGLAASLVSEGVNYICVVRGSAYGTWATRPDGHVEPGFNRLAAAVVRAALPEDVALVAQGSIVDVSLAGELVATGEADLVEMTRAQIADPALGRKLLRGELRRIRPCVLCNQNCRVRDVRNPIVSCIGEPSSGHEACGDRPQRPGAAGEASLSRPVRPPGRNGSVSPPKGGRDFPPGRALDVLVIGGGPAGLECARAAARAGHRVVVFERSEHFGGMVRVAARSPGRERLVLLTDWLESECRLAGVGLVAGHEVTLEEVDSHDGPVVHCSGSRPGRRTFDVAQGAAVATAAEVLAAERLAAEPPPSPVVVFDPVGGPIAVGVSELLISHGAEVTIVTPDHVVGERLALSGDLVPANARLLGRGAQLLRRSAVTHVAAGAVTVQHLYSGEVSTLPAALVVDAGFRLPEDGLWRAAGAGSPRAGDAVAPRTVYEAVLEGRRVADSLGTAGTPETGDDA